MTSIIKLQPFSGVHSESPPCYLLQVDEFRFLLDCGWSENFDMVFMENLKKHLPSIDVVLLSYPDPSHIGALPYLVGRCGLSCPIYATIPVYKMGQMYMYDLYQSRHNTEDFDLYTLDDVDSAFDKIFQLKYSQTVGLKGKGHGISITPLPAGHIVGGTVWKIVKDGEEEIVYAIDYNHKRERHLNGCSLDSILRPHVLITDAFNIGYEQLRRRARDEQLMSTIIETMRRGGNVLIAVDTAGRVLELAHLLDQLWRSQESGLSAYALAMLNNVAYNVVEFAKSQMEWMSDKLMKSFEDHHNNPFQFKQVQLCHSLGELAKVPDPKVVLASTPDMMSGFSRELFIQWSSDARNSIVITNRTTPGTLARNLIDNPHNRSINMDISRRVRLEGEELEEFQLKEKEREIEESKKKAAAAKQEEEEVESDESDTEEQTEDKTHLHDLMMKQPEIKSKGGFFKQSKKSHPMFPFVEEKIKWDEYGEIINPDDYRIAENVLPEEDNEQNLKIEEIAVQDTVKIPTKCLVRNQTIDVKANVVYIDFEGRSDGDSIKKILSQIKPRQLIIVRGTSRATNELADFLRKSGEIVQGNIYTPVLNEVLDATRESHIFQVRLQDSVVSALDFVKARETELAWVDGMVSMITTNTDTSAKPDDEEKGMDIDPDTGTEMIPSLLPYVGRGVTPGHQAVFVNEPKLSDFKAVLLKAGIQAEFVGGELICNNVIAVRKNKMGQMQLEGCLCPDYYVIRNMLYQQYAII